MRGGVAAGELDKLIRILGGFEFIGADRANFRDLHAL